MTNPEPTAPSTDIPMHLIVSFLTPMFLTTAGGDIDGARRAAIATINAYALRDEHDLLNVAQVIALGLAILDSLSRSMADDLPLALVLRLRGNAASLARAAERARRLLPQAPAQASSQPSEPDVEAERLKDEAVLANIAEVRQHLARINAGPRTTPQSAANPSRPINEIDANPLGTRLAANGHSREPTPAVHRP